MVSTRNIYVINSFLYWQMTTKGFMAHTNSLIMKTDRKYLVVNWLSPKKEVPMLAEYASVKRKRGAAGREDLRSALTYFSSSFHFMLTKWRPMSATKIRMISNVMAIDRMWPKNATLPHAHTHTHCGHTVYFTARGRVLVKRKCDSDHCMQRSVFWPEDISCFNCNGFQQEQWHEEKQKNESSERGSTVNGDFIY